MTSSLKQKTTFDSYVWFRLFGYEIFFVPDYGEEHTTKAHDRPAGAVQTTGCELFHSLQLLTSKEESDRRFSKQKLMQYVPFWAKAVRSWPEQILVRNELNCLDGHFKTIIRVFPRTHMCFEKMPPVLNQSHSFAFNYRSTTRHNDNKNTVRNPIPFQKSRSIYRSL